MSWIRVEVFAWLGDNAYFLLSPVVLSENVTMLRNFGLSLLLRRRDCRAYFPLLARLPILTESEDSLRREKSEELSRTNRRNQADPTQPEKLSSSLSISHLTKCIHIKGATDSPSMVNNHYNHRLQASCPCR
jgi:hypothetical protein